MNQCINLDLFMDNKKHKGKGNTITVKVENAMTVTIILMAELQMNIALSFMLTDSLTLGFLSTPLFPMCVWTCNLQSWSFLKEYKSFKKPPSLQSAQQGSVSHIEQYKLWNLLCKFYSFKNIKLNFKHSVISLKCTEV